MRRTIKVIFLESAKQEYDRLKEVVQLQIFQGKKHSIEIQLLRSINQKLDLLKVNPVYGNKIKKELLEKAYAVDNLWRVELTGYWRMLYTLKTDKIQINCFILDILDHNRYNKKFGYKKK